MQRRAGGEDKSKRPWREQAEQLRRGLERVERERNELERENRGLHKPNERLEDQNARLKRELDAARRGGLSSSRTVREGAHWQAAPARAAEQVPAMVSRPRRRKPTRVDERHEAPLPPACPDCGGALRPTDVATQIQEELPVPQVVVCEFDVAIGACRACGHRVQGRHRLQTSDALGGAGVQLGPQVVAAAVILNKQLGLRSARLPRSCGNTMA